MTLTMCLLLRHSATSCAGTPWHPVQVQRSSSTGGQAMAAVSLPEDQVATLFPSNILAS